MDTFMYKNLISTFFVDGNLIDSRPERLKKCFEYVINSSPPTTSCKKINHQINKKINDKIATVDVTFMKKWRASGCTDLENFEEENQDWIQRILELPSEESNKRTGRPKKDGFYNLSDRSKNRRAAELTECELEKLLLASAQAAKKSGEKDMEHVLKLLYNDREVAKKIRDLLKTDELLAKKPKPVKITPSRGLSHLLDNRFSKSQYQNTRLLTKDHGSDIFPSYNKIRKAKKECRPPADCMIINDDSASLPMQNLLDHTAARLLLLQEEVIKALKVENDEIVVTLNVKWGGDGSSDQSQYNQKYTNTKSAKNSDANLFAITIVPIRMTVNDLIILWNNLTPQSPRWCRILRMLLAKETPELTLKELESVKEEIKNLLPFTTTIAGKKITVIYKLYLTMIDGKVLQVITRTSSAQVCSICDATPKQFNDLRNPEIRFKPKEGSLNYGVSVLHLWIRSFEWLLHISYRIKVKPFPKWQMRGPVLKEAVKKRKFKLQRRFWDKMSLRVDFPSKGGSGNSNSGPVARRAFAEPEVLAEILELDVDLVKRVRTMLIALSCQLPLDTDLFSAFCDETAILYTSKYKWFPMPQSVHKILIHSRDLMLASDLPLGVLAEDAAESCNKLYRHNRQFHARKVSREKNLTDVFNRALDSSDPIISSFTQQRRQNSRHRKSLPTEVLQLLKGPDAPEPACKVDETLLLEDNDNGSLDDPLDEILNSLDGVCLPEDPMYNNDDDDYDYDEYGENSFSSDDSDDEDILVIAKRPRKE